MCIHDRMLTAQAGACLCLSPQCISRLYEEYFKFDPIPHCVFSLGTPVFSRSNSRSIGIVLFGHL
jgi:hypothetical protein